MYCNVGADMGEEGLPDMGEEEERTSHVIPWIATFPSHPSPSSALRTNGCNSKDANLNTRAHFPAHLIWCIVKFVKYCCIANQTNANYMAEPSTFKIWDTRVIRWWQIWMLAFSSDVWKDKTHIHRCSSFDVCVLAHWISPSHHTHRWEKGGKTDVWFLLAELSTRSTDRWTTEHPSVLLLVLQHIVQCAIYNVCNVQKVQTDEQYM